MLYNQAPVELMISYIIGRLSYVIIINLSTIHNYSLTLGILNNMN